MSKTAQSKRISRDARVEAMLAEASIEQPCNMSTVSKHLMMQQPWNTSSQVSKAILRWGVRVDLVLACITSTR